MDTLRAVVLAAGKGTRLASEQSDLPKVMRCALGQPLLAYVLSAIDFIEKRNTLLVVGYKKEKVTEAFPEYPCAVQTEQLGTGHAVMAARDALSGYSGHLLVCYGDMPLVRRETYRALVETHIAQGNDCTILTGTSDLPLPYGRVIRDEAGSFVRVVEDRDCTPDEARVRELNSGVYMFSAPVLLSALGALKRSNTQGEYYITDVPAVLCEQGKRVGLCKRELQEEILGVNTPAQLQQVESALARRVR